MAIICCSLVVAPLAGASLLSQNGAGRGPLIGLIAAAAAGTGISAYLTVVHYSDAPLACNTAGPLNCTAVTSSTFSFVPATQAPITIPGLVWFAISGLAAGVALSGRSPRWLAAAHAGWTVLALGVTFYLVYAELVVIHSICEWCTGVHLLILLSLMLAFRRWQLAALE
jgi:uncharacterized membrane protein